MESEDRQSSSLKRILLVIILIILIILIVFLLLHKCGNGISNNSNFLKKIGMKDYF